MTCRSSHSKRALLLWAAAMAGLLLSSSVVSAQEFEIKSVAEKKIQQLPPGPLFWRIDNFPALAQAQGAAGPTALFAEVAGKVWLFTLGPKEGRRRAAPRWSRSDRADHQCARVFTAYQQCGRAAGS